MTFAPDYVDKFIAPILRSECIGTFTKDEYVANYDNPWAKCWNIHWGLSGERRLPDDHPDTQPQFRAIRREDIVRVGGFDDIGYTDDLTLYKKLGKMAQVAPGAVCSVSILAL